MSKDAQKFWRSDLDQKGRLRYLRIADGDQKYADGGWEQMPKPLRSLIGRLMNIRKWGFRWRVEDSEWADMKMPERDDISPQAQDQWVDVVARVIDQNAGYISLIQLKFLVRILGIPQGLLDVAALVRLGYSFKSMDKAIVGIDGKYTYMKLNDGMGRA